MVQHKKVRAEAILGVEVGRELMEDELAAICGGSASSSPSDAGFGAAPGLPDLTNLLAPQSAAASSKGNADNTPFPGFAGLGQLSNLTGGLLGKMI